MFIRNSALQQQWKIFQGPDAGLVVFFLFQLKEKLSFMVLFQLFMH